ncbi:hypothetical protein HYPBUDRAFT_109535 [Hyphopichia burtonii NRRL Y-1933]|uniref:tRNA-splicing endonuclease subunit Sen2 n=1 Tax=Hyphopichia burtonii NRRL Y-1933 TaxID=984485 RepID=A0A1E4RIL8_9ASCO|nr:hypothetical protein HYPBUDRAFT_109535 [Hyphopichia burtonii NRRL Y-1933]ODV67117.1 hypothetical protein HYPBUDRAFT_109535 [Hyphopichia burtonii NRRL Y-1933]
MGKRNNKILNQIYTQPLPVKVYGGLPTIFPHNPISWIYFGYVYIRVLREVGLEQTIEVEVEDRVFKVDREESMMILWRQGFFGKGNLSRSEPTWRERIKRLNEEELSNEDITKVRREERKRFKNERSKLQELELKQRQDIINPQEQLEMNALQKKLEEFKVNYDSKKIKPDVIIQDANLEYLQLQPVEVMFLKYLSAIKIFDNGLELTNEQLFQKCTGQHQDQITSSNQFILEYVVYHHFRSLGWCVRSGIKFGCDYLLYKRGPPFSHAEYGIYLMTGEKKWTDIQALTRVIGGVKKCFVLVYIDIPDLQQFNQALQTKNCSDLLKLYKVTPILYKRWVPSKTRD